MRQAYGKEDSLLLWEIQICFLVFITRFCSRYCQRYICADQKLLSQTFLNLFFVYGVAKGRWLSSKTLYNFEQWRLWSVALILPLSADGGCDARALDDLRRAWIGLPVQQKCFVASIIPLWH